MSRTLNSTTLNGGARVSWWVAATVLATATATAIPPAPGFVQRGQSFNTAAASLSATGYRKLKGTGSGFAQATPSIVPQVSRGVRATGLAGGTLEVRLLQTFYGNVLATAGATGISAQGTQFAQVSEVAGGTLTATATPGRPGRVIASAVALITPTGVVDRGVSAAAPLTGVSYAHVETTLALVADNGWVGEGPWAGDWALDARTIWQHEAYSYQATAGASGAIDPLQPIVVHHFGPYGAAQSYVFQVFGALGHPGAAVSVASASGRVLGGIRYFGGVSLASASGTLAGRASIKFRASSTASATAQHWLTSARVYQQARSTGQGVATLLAATSTRRVAGRVLGAAQALANEVPLPTQRYAESVGYGGAIASVAAIAKVHATAIGDLALAASIRLQWAYPHRATSSSITGAALTASAALNSWATVRATGDGTADVTGTSVQFATAQGDIDISLVALPIIFAQTPAPDSRQMVVGADYRLMLVPFDDRTLRVVA